jgi:glycosyltransferase involved in cell wall biosynthesis
MSTVPEMPLLRAIFENLRRLWLPLSDKVLADLRRFEAVKPALLVQHPLYDNFGEKVPKEAAREALNLDRADKIILFFGFIRKYKGLDLLLQAMADKRLQDENIKLLVAGEFYEMRKCTSK